MNSDRILKKAVFGGFNRADVMDYVEKLQSENAALAEEVRLRSEDGRRLEALSREYEKQTAEIKNTKAMLDDARGRLNSFGQQISRLNDEVKVLKAENDSLKNSLSQKENELSSVSSEFAVLKSDKSNSLIQDAMKYSDSLVESAKESAGRALVKAGDSISAASLDIKTAGERVRTAQVNLDYSLNSVKAGVDKLIEELEGAINSLHTGE